MVVLTTARHPPPFFEERISEADSNEVVRFLKGKGLSKIAEQSSDVAGLELVEDLKLLQEEELNDPEYSFLRQWQRKRG